MCFLKNNMIKKEKGKRNERNIQKEKTFIIKKSKNIQAYAG